LLKRIFSGITLAMLFISMLTLTFNIQSIKASGTIYIRPDGSIDPPTAPIHRVGDMYTFTDDIYNSIVVERSGIVIDGAGYTVQGTGSGDGITLSGRSNVVIRNMEIERFEYGVFIEGSFHNTVSGNNITANSRMGVGLWSSQNNSVSGNNITANNDVGVWLYSSCYNTVSDNNIKNNSRNGVTFRFSSNNTLSGNIFVGDGFFADDSYNSLVVGNSVNGKSLVYLERVSDVIVKEKAGQVILVSCNRIRVENLNLSHTHKGVELLRTNSTTLTGNNITANEYGISLWYSFNNTISGNNITANEYGVWLYSSSNNNTVFENNIANNDQGLHLNSSPSGNRFFHNNFIDNRFYQVHIYSPSQVNIWDDGYPSGGNYWSDYEERYPDAEEFDGSGIWDTSYVIDENNQDSYPLMKPWAPPTLAPDFSLTDIDGNDFSLSDYRGTVVLLDFFATWCVPAVEQISDLKILHEEFGEDLTIISISPQNETVLKDFRDDYDVGWTIAKDTAGVFDAYDVQYIPTLVIIDQSGYIRYRHVGLTEESVLRQEIESLLPRIWTVDDDLQDYPMADFTKIQDAVDAATAGDTIIVYPGTYTENVNVNKSLTIKSKNGADSTIVQATNPDDHVIEITTDDVDISGFTVRGATENNMVGIRLSNVNYCNISNNRVTNNWGGVYLEQSSHNNVINNEALNNWEGIVICYSDSNFIYNNTVLNNAHGILVYRSSGNNIVSNIANLNNYYSGIYIGYSSNNILTNNIANSNTENGIHLFYSSNNKLTNNIANSNDLHGIFLVSSSNNTLTNNIVSNNNDGVCLTMPIDSNVSSNDNVLTYNTVSNNAFYGFAFYSSCNNILYNNNISLNNNRGIELYHASNSNKIYLNNFIDNRDNVYSSSDSTNIWNSTSKMTYTYNGSIYTNYLGNYWSDYRGSDANNDGIGDTPCNIDGHKDS